MVGDRRRRRPQGPEKATGDGEGEQSVDEGSGIEQTSVGDVGVPPLQAALEVSLPFPLKILLSFFSSSCDRSQCLEKMACFVSQAFRRFQLSCLRFSRGIVPGNDSSLCAFSSLLIFLGFCVGEICLI